MGSASLTNLRSRVRELADMQNSQFVTDAATSLDAFINASLQRLHARLATKLRESYTYASSSFTTAAAGISNTSYTLPSAFFYLLGVDLYIDGKYTALRPYSFAERNTLRNATTDTLKPKYRLLGTKINILPLQADGIPGTIHYIPELTPLVNGADTVVLPAGFEEWAVCDAAIQTYIKEESAPDYILQRRREIEAEIDEVAAQRDSGMPSQIVDVEAVDADWEVS